MEFHLAETYQGYKIKVADNGEAYYVEDSKT